MASAIDTYKENSQREANLIPRLVSLLTTYEGYNSSVQERYEAIEHAVRILEIVCLTIQTHTHTGQTLHAGFMNILNKATKAAVDVRVTQQFADEIRFLQLVHEMK